MHRFPISDAALEKHIELIAQCCVRDNSGITKSALAQISLRLTVQPQIHAMADTEQSL